MRKTLFIILFLVSSLCHIPAAVTDEMLAPLDSALSHRDDYMRKKELRLDRLRHSIRYTRDGHKRIALYEKMYEEYYTYRFDSAMSYAKREYELAVSLKASRYITLAQLHRSLLLATSGYYSEAEHLFESVDTSKMDRQLWFTYNWTGLWIYSYWSGYSQGNDFVTVYDEKRNEYIQRSLSYADRGSALWCYLYAELVYYRDHDLKTSLHYYSLAEKWAPQASRIYASATYGLARCYKEMGQMQRYEYWSIRSAISDQLCPLKENLSLQELAMHLFQKDERNAERASRYLYFSLDDAKFYHNKLRILGISEKLPGIMAVYERQLYHSKQVRTRQNYLLGVLAVVLLCALVVILRQNKKLNRKEREVSRQNDQLTLMNQQLTQANSRREKYMRLFMDLCALYIGKLNNYQKLVVRKIKTHQEGELVQKANSTKLTESEAIEFNSRFDKAFMELFPTFVDQFNALLCEGKKVEVSGKGGLTTELRIYALVRLGVNESVEIATLLFYSPQTIYNYRTALRKRAINPETFEDDVRALH